MCRGREDAVSTDRSNRIYGSRHFTCFFYVTRSWGGSSQHEACVCTAWLRARTHTTFVRCACRVLRRRRNSTSCGRAQRSCSRGFRAARAGADPHRQARGGQTHTCATWTFCQARALRQLADAWPRTRWAFDESPFTPAIWCACLADGDNVGLALGPRRRSHPIPTNKK